jgi:hypothetical protein
MVDEPALQHHDMSDSDEGARTERAPRFNDRPHLVAGLLVGVSIVLAAGALASCSSSPSSSVPAGDQQAASSWVQNNPQMWSWMQGHWDEMRLMSQHWSDIAWMRANLPDFAWMHDHWGDMTWMHDHWSGMEWMHGQMMGTASGGMMGQTRPTSHSGAGA